MAEPLRTVLRPRLPVSLGPTLRTLRHGPRDPSVRIRDAEAWLTLRTVTGPATVHLHARNGEIHVASWGPGRGEALDVAPALVGARDDLTGWEPRRLHAVAELDRLNPGVRFVATGQVLATAVPTVLEQKVQSREAHEAWLRMMFSWGEAAPGPEGGPQLRLRPAPRRLAAERYPAYHRFGIERRRAEVVRGLADRHQRAEEAAALGTAGGRARLEAFAGVGGWTSAKVAAVAWADADAVAVGDYHLPEIVVYALTGRRGGDDDAMLELLEPFRPHRGRAARLLKMSGLGPPRRAPRARLRDFRAS